MRRVYSSDDPTVIELLRNLLAREDIETKVLNETSPWGAGLIPFLIAVPELWVLRDEDAPRAREIVDRYESGAIREAFPKDLWQCPKCGEMVEGQFTECWRCSGDPRLSHDTTCDQCGHPLRGLPERRCPECGGEF